MIVHVFNTKFRNLVPSISKGFATVYLHDAEHFFVLYGRKEMDKQLYVNLYSQIGFNDYCFCQSYWQLVKYLFHFRKKTILFHAGSYFWHLTALLLRCKNVNWVCWGGGTSISKNLRSNIGGMLKAYMFNNFHSIVTLMEPERKEIIKNFKVNPKKINTISYMSVNEDESELNLYCKQLSRQGSVNADKPVVLLGNSQYWIRSYIEMLPRLSKYKGKIKVQCMLNYPFEKTENYNELVRLGRSIFGDDFRTNEDYYSDRKDYINYMNSCDIYICSVEKQAGLGAISTCLQLGKKIYITGNNLEWVRNEYNSVVFPIGDINEDLSIDAFVKPLSSEEKDHNYRNRVKCKKLNREKWHNYLQNIDNN